MTDLEHLFRTYHTPLVRYLTRRLGDRDWAEEVAQETFLRAMRHVESRGEALTSERSWLFAVATNLVRDEARRESRRRQHLQLLTDEVRECEREVVPSTLEQGQEAAFARRALDSLAERDRLALLMREEGLDYQEIAEALDLSPGSVGTTLARARRRLAEMYETLSRERQAREAHAAS